jgi:ERF superfamily
MDNDYDVETGEVNIKPALNRLAEMAMQATPETPKRMREEEVYRAPVVSDYEERGTEAQISALYGALASARAKFTPFARSRKVEVKNKEGKFLYSFKYAPMELLLESTTPALSANGLILLMPFVTGADQVAKQLVILAHAQGGRLVFRFEFHPAGDEKTFGAQTTYLQRYCYRSVLSLAADGDLEEQPSRANEGTVEGSDVKRPTGSERLQLRDGKAQAVVAAALQPAQVPIPEPNSKDNKLNLSEMLTLAKKVGFTKRSEVAGFVWKTVAGGEPFDLGEPFCSELTASQLQQCFEALTKRLPAKAARS